MMRSSYQPLPLAAMRPPTPRQEASFWNGVQQRLGGVDITAIKLRSEQLQLQLPTLSP